MFRATAIPRWRKKRLNFTEKVMRLSSCQAGNTVSPRAVSAGVLSGAEKYHGSYETEWEFLRDVLVKNGVKPEDILREDRATYTYENALFSREVTEKAGLSVKKAILCCKSHHARRVLMYFQYVYPETEFLVCPSFPDGITRSNWNHTELGVDAVTGEVTRIIRQFSLMMDKK